MIKIISIITLFATITLAGGSGHSFGGSNTSNKYGDRKTGKSYIEIPNTSTSSCNENIKVYTYSKVRYRNWFYLIHDWRDGYATSTAKQCGNKVPVSKLVIEQYVHHDSNMNGMVPGIYSS